MDFPSYALRLVSVTAQMTKKAIGVKPEDAYMARNLLCAFRLCRYRFERIACSRKGKRTRWLVALHYCTRKRYRLCFPFLRKKMRCFRRSSLRLLPLSYLSLLNNSTWKKFVAFYASKRGRALYCRMGDRRVTLAGKTHYSLLKRFSWMMMHYGTAMGCGQSGRYLSKGNLCFCC